MSGTITCTACLTAFQPEATPGGMCPTCLLARGAEAAASVAAESAGSGPSAQPARFELPDAAELAALFPQLVVEELLGHGGMGAVYRARQRELDRPVALKILPAASGRDPDFAERFRREARALAGLSHPGIVSVFDFGRAGDICWILMELVEGVTLRGLMADGPVAPRQALSLVRQLCDALAYAHGQGVVHRDIKPENILVDGAGSVRVVDFGLARLLDARADELSLTVTGQRMGTPHYMAPEQWEDPASVDHRADIYALGVVFYELLTHELPVGRFLPPSRKVAVSVDLDQVVLRALERDRELRYQATTDMRTDVDTQLDGGPVPVAAVTPDNAAPPAPSHGARERARARTRRDELGNVGGAAALWARLQWVLGVFLATLGGAATWQAIMFLDWPGPSRREELLWLLAGGVGAMALGLLWVFVARHRLLTLEQRAGHELHRTWPERPWLVLPLAALGIASIAVGNELYAGPRQLLHTGGPSLLLLVALGFIVRGMIWLQPQREDRRRDFVLASLLVFGPWCYLLHARSDELQQNAYRLEQARMGTVPGLDGSQVPMPPTALTLRQLAHGQRMDGEDLLTSWIDCEFVVRDMLSRAEPSPARWRIDFAEPSASPAGHVLVFEASATVDGRPTEVLASSFVVLGNPHTRHGLSLDVDLSSVVGEALDRSAAELVPRLGIRLAQAPSGLGDELDLSRLQGGTSATWSGPLRTVFVYPRYPEDYPLPVDDLQYEAGMLAVHAPVRVRYRGLVKDREGERAVRLELETERFRAGPLPVAFEVGVLPSVEWLGANGFDADAAPATLATGPLVVDAAPGNGVAVGTARRSVDLRLVSSAAPFEEAFLLDLAHGRVGAVRLTLRGSREVALSTPHLDRFWDADVELEVPVVAR